MSNRRFFVWDRRTISCVYRIRGHPVTVLASLQLPALLSRITTVAGTRTACIAARDARSAIGPGYEPESLLMEYGGL